MFEVFGNPEACVGPKMSGTISKTKFSFYII